MKIERGTVLLVSLDPTVGHEQRGARPCVVVSDPIVTHDQRFPMVAVVPLTGTPGEGALYPCLRPGPSGLRKPSWALVDQLRSIDKRRVTQLHGVVEPEELAAIDNGLRLFLVLPATGSDAFGPRPSRLLPS
jgi:mRNA interferase MazF